ncbi:MAG: glycoside hydrolase family 43 protein [Lachnospiraceae bacterium]
MRRIGKKIAAFLLAATMMLPHTGIGVRAESTITIGTQEKCTVVTDTGDDGSTTVTIQADTGYELGKINVNDETVYPTTLSEDRKTATYVIADGSEATVDVWCDPENRLEMEEISQDFITQLGDAGIKYKSLPTGFSDDDVVQAYDHATYPGLAVFDAGEGKKYQLSQVITYARMDMPGRAQLKIYGSDTISVDLFQSANGANNTNFTALTNSTRGQWFGTGSWSNNTNTGGKDSVRGDYTVDANDGYRYIVIESDHQYMLSLSELKIYGQVLEPGEVLYHVSAGEGVTLVNIPSDGYVMEGTKVRYTYNGQTYVTDPLNSDITVESNSGSLVTDDKYSKYLFVHFTGNEQTANDEQIYFSVSEDALTWKALNQGQPILKSTLGTTGVRDPHIVRSPEGDKFYLIATDLHIYDGAGWTAAQYSGSKKIMIWESTDLVNWSEQREVEIGVEGAGCVWAPESIWDHEKNAYMVFWASMVQLEGDSAAKQRIYRSYTTDFVTFTEPEIYIERDNHVIDTTILEQDGVYYRYSKDETTTQVMLDYSTSLDGPWKSTNLAISKCEGPTAFKYNGENKWGLFVDSLGASWSGYGLHNTSDMLADSYIFTETTQEIKLRHGTVIPITDEEYNSLVEKYPMTVATDEDASLTNISYSFSADTVASAGSLNSGDVQEWKITSTPEYFYIDNVNLDYLEKMTIHSGHGGSGSYTGTYKFYAYDNGGEAVTKEQLQSFKTDSSVLGTEIARVSDSNSGWGYNTITIDKTEITQDKGDGNYVLDTANSSPLNITEGTGTKALIMQVEYSNASPTAYFDYITLSSKFNYNAADMSIYSAGASKEYASGSEILNPNRQELKWSNGSSDMYIYIPDIDCSKVTSITAAFGSGKTEHTISYYAVNGEVTSDNISFYVKEDDVPFASATVAAEGAWKYLYYRLDAETAASENKIESRSDHPFVDARTAVTCSEAFFAPPAESSTGMLIKLNATNAITYFDQFTFGFSEKPEPDAIALKRLNAGQITCQESVEAAYDALGLSDVMTRTEYNALTDTQKNAVCAAITGSKAATGTEDNKCFTKGKAVKIAFSGAINEQKAIEAAGTKQVASQGAMIRNKQTGQNGQAFRFVSILNLTKASLTGQTITTGQSTEDGLTGSDEKKVRYGMLIIPQAAIDKSGQTLTITVDENDRITAMPVTVSGKEYQPVHIQSKVVYEGTENHADYIKYTGVLTGIGEAYYNRAFYAVSYCVVGAGEDAVITYSDEVSRTMSTIAQTAIDSETQTQEQVDFLTPIANAGNAQ